MAPSYSCRNTAQARRAQNELTRFRYDVMLHVGEQAPPQWTARGSTGRSRVCRAIHLSEILQKTQPEMLGLTGVPNARIGLEAAGGGVAHSEDGAGTVE